MNRTAATSNWISRRELLKLAGATAAAAGVATTGSALGPLASRRAAAGGGDTFSVYWHPGHAYDAYERVVEEFEEAHGVNVNMQYFQWPDLRTRILADFEAGTVPDVAEISSWTREFAISGDALSLQEFIEADGDEMGFPDDWQPGALTSNLYEDEHYGIRFHFTCTLLLYNRAMLADAGVEPPTTWDEFVETAAALTDDGVFGVALNQDHSYSWPWLFQNEVRYYDPDSGEVLVPHDAAVEALQLQADLVHEHQVSPIPTPGTDYAGPQQLFSAERAAMILTGPWDLLPIAEASPDIDFGIAPALTGRVQATVAGGASMLIPAQARRPELSWDFIKRITALETELAATEEATMLMPRQSWAEHPAVLENEHVAAFAEGLAYAQDITPDLELTGRSGEVGTRYGNTYQAIVVQNNSAEDEVEKFVDAAEGILSS